MKLDSVSICAVNNNIRLLGKLGDELDIGEGACDGGCSSLNNCIVMG
jgi:hypothetical protein